MSDRPRLQTARPLIIRIYLSTVVLILSVGVSFTLLNHQLLRHHFHFDIHERAASVARHLAWTWDNPVNFEQELEDFRHDPRMRISVYSLQGGMRGGSARVALPPLTEAQLGQLEKTPEGQYLPTCSADRCPVAYPLRTVKGLEGYALFEFPPPPPARNQWPLGLAITFTAAAIASLLLSRSVARPISKLVAAARALGEGDLKARAGLNRRDELGQLSQAFDEMAERVSHLVHSQKQLLADVSHELRTPLARIRVALDLVNDTDEAAAKDSLLGITEDLAELEALVSDVLATARFDLETGRVATALPPVRLETVEVGVLLSRSVDRFKANNTRHSIQLSKSGSLPTIQADPALLRRAIDNLLENAAKYSDIGSTVTLRGGMVDKQLQIEVQDDGIGIEPADLARVFAPFFRTDRSRTRKTGGVGLGLALTRRIVEAHKGQITLESQVGIGTTARIRIPL